MADRKFRWVSYSLENENALNKLNDKMGSFYGNSTERELYQGMVEEVEEFPPHDTVRYQLPKFLVDNQGSNLLEIGCANGRVYRQLRAMGLKSTYTGVDMPEYLLANNRKLHPESTWLQASVYNLPFQDEAFDMIFSLYVIEHLVFPEKALIEQLRVLKPGGKIVLVFPDFVSLHKLPSQVLGFSPGTASEKLKKGKIVDAVISLYDSRIRLPKALNKATKLFGKFPINLSPMCLDYPSFIRADVDAVYIASKNEIAEWAVGKGCRTEFPCGTEGEYADQAFVVISKE